MIGVIESLGLFFRDLIFLTLAQIMCLIYFMCTKFKMQYILKFILYHGILLSFILSVACLIDNEIVNLFTVLIIGTIYTTKGLKIKGKLFSIFSNVTLGYFSILVCQTIVFICMSLITNIDSMNLTFIQTFIGATLSSLLFFTSIKWGFSNGSDKKNFRKKGRKGN